MSQSIAPTLRAMASNYAGGHSWDHLDGEAVTRAADEIDALRGQLSELKKGLESQVVEGLRADNKWLRAELDKALLRLAERDALLREVLEFIDDGVGRSGGEWAIIQKARTALSASAEPSAPACCACGPTENIGAEFDVCVDCQQLALSGYGKQQAHDLAMSAQVERDERKLFEKAVIDKAERFHPDLKQYGDQPDAEYRDASLEWAWGLWRARAALERKPS
ncbi:hypothetical protein P0Y43_23100 [Pseudomonas entomophila]|uniref:hypothetical protein n=1 Tax=Pseudomonas entomophila TaxID=312306 RepID=UPI0023D859CA|nr:hypothetical protein [Pseudomonas entomophila]MDF0733584.1 hypothetical protein [Pseudomonas entomophila]